MKRFLAAALLFASPAFATAAPVVDAAPVARPADGLVLARDHDDERGRRHHGWDDDDEDDDDHHHHRRHHEHHGHHGDRDGDRGGARRADPNAANAPVPDNGVFKDKSRPKVEVK